MPEHRHDSYCFRSGSLICGRIDWVDDISDPAVRKMMEKRVFAPPCTCPAPSFAFEEHEADCPSLGPRPRVVVTPDEPKETKTFRTITAGAVAAQTRRQQQSAELDEYHRQQWLTRIASQKSCHLDHAQLRTEVKTKGFTDAMCPDCDERL